MKIAMIGHKRIPSREGGVEIVVEELATRMAAQGHTVVAYNRKGQNVADKKADLELHKLKEYKGVKLKNVFTFRNRSLNAIVYAFNATLRVIFGRYDVVHYHAEGSCVFLPLAHLFGKRTVVTIHGLDWQRSKWGGFATKMLKFGERMAAKYADEIIVLSRNIQDYFMKTYYRETRYIPNGVNIPEKRKAKIITEKYGLQKDSYILFLARLVPEKEAHLLIEAFKKLDTDKKLVIAGGSSHSNEYVARLKKMAADDSRIVMVGFVQGKTIAELFSNCSLYVLPSDVEGMPISLLEAMSFGCNCLVSDIPENVEAINRNAETFKKGDVDSLCAKLKSCLERNAEGTADGTALQNYCKKRYNWDRVVEDTLILYSLN